MEQLWVQKHPMSSNHYYYNSFEKPPSDKSIPEPVMSTVLFVLWEKETNWFGRNTMLHNEDVSTKQTLSSTMEKKLSSSIFHFNIVKIFQISTPARILAFSLNHNHQSPILCNLMKTHRALNHNGRQSMVK